ncbi:MAG: ABC transporter substrate-binding protein, partial [Deltaproteobacteria bacterium]
VDRVRDMLEAVMAVQAQPQLQGPEFREKRRIAIKKIISENFDLDKMAVQSLDSSWKQLSDSRRREFKEIFRDLFQDSYTRLVLDFLRQEKILYLKEDPGKDGILVETMNLRTNEEISVNYLISPLKEGGLVQDVVIDGVSIVGNYRKSFARFIQRESYEALLERMRVQQRAIEGNP